MKHFKHMQATSADQAAKEAASGKAWVMAGGTDLLGTLKDEIFPEYPETVIDLKTIEGRTPSRRTATRCASAPWRSCPMWPRTSW